MRQLPLQTLRAMNIQTMLANTIGPKDVLEFWTNHGLNFQKVRDVTGFDAGDIARIAGVPETLVRFDHLMSVDIKEHMEVITNICNLVFQFFDNEVKTRLWLQTPNPMLGGVAPRDMIRAGRSNKLLKFVIDAIEDEASILGSSSR